MRITPTCITGTVTDGIHLTCPMHPQVRRGSGGCCPICGMALEPVAPAAGGEAAYNLLAVPLAAGLLYPTLGLLLNPIVAAAAMSLSSVSVITNALRLRFVQL